MGQGAQNGDHKDDVSRAVFCVGRMRRAFAIALRLRLLLCAQTPSMSPGRLARAREYRQYDWTMLELTRRLRPLQVGLLKDQDDHGEGEEGHDEGNPGSATYPLAPCPEPRFCMK